ncbi:hypothetical protein B6A42_02515 [Vibrio coralliilyticus]|nr:hypothetical protein B6A42_02515 [Vibrio coralliilyticus]
MSTRKDYYDLHQSIRMGDAMHTYLVCCRVGFDVAKAVDIALSNKRKRNSLSLRLWRYKRTGKLAPKSCRV